ncbi:hypothetical protein OG21DRAFT_1077516 [Imleria badia]|nr:hypothetical protein OG21DRAFT_1077516 [Imleria badia]
MKYAHAYYADLQARSFHVTRVHFVQGRFQGVILIMIGEWMMFTFIASADLVMILRVWAIYGRSRTILGILLTLYALEIVPFIIISTKSELVVTTQVLDFSFCTFDFGPGTPIWVEVRDSLQLAIAAVMCLLVIAKFILHTFQMDKITKQWQFGHYLDLFAREGMLYFLAFVHISSFQVPFQRVTENITHAHLPTM